MAPPPLPRSLDPLPWESLPGYLLRLAHRLDLPPARIAVLTGLGRSGPAGVPASRLFALDPATREAFARATRLTTAEATALTLVSLADRYPPLDPAFSGRHRLTHGIFVKETWVFFRASRYCPDCLAGDGSPIQHRHGGGWSLHWRLPVVFACPAHRRLLAHACPRCGTPAHYRAAHQAGQLLRLAGRAGLHPAQCRAPTVGDIGTKPVGVCGARLDQPPRSRPLRDVGDDLLAFQARLLELLDQDGPAVTTSAGQASSPQRYIVDLRILSCLITASWPAARDLVEQPHQTRLIDQHLRRIRRDIAAVRDSGRVVRELAFYDTPPLDAATGAALLAAADRITTTGDTTTVRDLLRPLVTQAPSSMAGWIKQFLAGDGYCSPGLQLALGLATNSPHVLKRAGIPPPRIVVPAPQPMRFGVRHIPQHVLPEWYEEHLARFANQVKPRLLRRAAAARLAQLCVGGPIADAGQLLGIPRDASINAVAVVGDRLRPRARRAFDAAVDALADHLDTATQRIDYGQRRAALKTWSLSPPDWDELTAGLRAEPAPPMGGRWPGTPFIDWGEAKRILASMWIWVRITGGEHLFAPAIRPHPDQQRPSRRDRSNIHNRWPHISAERPHGHYAALRERLDAYADILSTEIDNHGTPTRPAIRHILAVVPSRGDQPTHWTHDTATMAMRQAGFEPLEPYSGMAVPWRCRCLRCGNQATPIFGNARRQLGHGCRHCARRNPEAAIQEMRNAGLEPLEPYPGRVQRGWRCRCRRCGTEVLAKVAQIRAGKNCCRVCRATANPPANTTTRPTSPTRNPAAF